MKFDYIYINPEGKVLGRSSKKDYHRDEDTGILLGWGNDVNMATKIAMFHEPKLPYGIRYSEKITNPDIAEFTQRKQA